MRKAHILFKGEEAGILTQHNDGSFTFNYHTTWAEDRNKPHISLTLPKKSSTHYSKFLFPFFYNMLPEGSNKQLICKHFRIDANDYFGLLLATAKTDTIGAVTVIKAENL